MGIGTPAANSAQTREGLVSGAQKDDSGNKSILGKICELPQLHVSCTAARESPRGRGGGGTLLGEVGLSTPPAL